MIRAIIDWALRNRLLVLLLTVLSSVLGVIVYERMPKDIYPDLNAPLVNIITSYPGMPAEDVERLISIPLESLMSGTPRVIRVRSESTTGESVVTVEFDWGTDVYLARQIVAGKLEIVAEQLPLGASRPIMGPVSSRMGEIFECAVVGDGVEPMELRSVADWVIRYRLLGVEGVSFVINLGGFAREYQVFLKPEMLHHYGIGIADVKEAIEKSNRNFSGGIITKQNQEFLIKGLGRIESLSHIQNTVITSRKNVPVFVKDVADVKVGGRFRRGDAGFNGQEAVSVVVEKQYGGDTLKTISNIQRFLSDIKRDISDKIKIIPYYDQSKLILNALSHVEVAMLEGGFLVVLVILLFLGNLRASLIALLTIPISILLALIMMYVGNVSLTVMALGGLAIGIGKMAAGSVIMVENIYKSLHGDSNDASALELTSRGAKEVGPYLFSANLIIILVFLPLLALQGIAGRMFRPTAFAVVAALFGALIINITLQPVLMSICLGGRGRRRRENPFVTLATRVYGVVLEKSFRHKGTVLLLSLVIIVTAGVCYRHLGTEFVPFLDEGSIVASTVMLPETSLQESVRIGKKVEKIFLSFPEVASVCRTTGMAEEAEHVHPVNHSHYLIDLKPRSERTRDYTELTQAMREKLGKIPGIVYIFEQPIANKMAEMLTGAEGQISLKLFGPDLDVLNAKTREIRDVMGRIPGIADLQIEQTTGIPLVQIVLKRECLARYGIKVEEVADLIETALNGVEATDVRETNRVTAVLVRLPEEYRQNEEAIKNLLVDTPSGNRILLSQIADIDKSEGPQTIFREGLKRRKIILCNVVGRDIGGFVEEAKAAIAPLIPEGCSYEFGGQFESQQETMKQLTWMMLVVALSVLVVLFASLGSLRQSLLLLLNIPMTLAGGIIALYLAGQTVNVSSVIGFIALFGIALQNGVVLVGKINDLRKSGQGLHEAVIQGALGRFRPILMTELILILGVLPLAMARTSGSELHRPLAVVYIGGFVVAIFFEQIALPVFYEVFSRMKKEQSFS
ncbi:MAG: efflux RND transporter permease subunit [Pirellulales bacterium]|nr:efflux RND transporter permease subunit [Pirellulales bacterium]